MMKFFAQLDAFGGAVYAAADDEVNALPDKLYTACIAVREAAVDQLPDQPPLLLPV